MRVGAAKCVCLVRARVLALGEEAVRMRLLVPDCINISGQGSLTAPKNSAKGTASLSDGLLVSQVISPDSCTHIKRKGVSHRVNGDNGIARAIVCYQPSFFCETKKCICFVNGYSPVVSGIFTSQFSQNLKPSMPCSRHRAPDSSAISSSSVATPTLQPNLSAVS